jgi:hypothetical protein
MPYREMRLKVQLAQDPDVHAWVSTTEPRNRARRKSIVNDIRSQQFPRWAPFRGQEYTIQAFEADGVTPFDFDVREFPGKAAE